MSVGKSADGASVIIADVVRCKHALTAACDNIREVLASQQYDRRKELRKLSRQMESAYVSCVKLDGQFTPSDVVQSRSLEYLDVKARTREFCQKAGEAGYATSSASSSSTSSWGGTQGYARSSAWERPSGRGSIYAGSRCESSALSSEKQLKLAALRVKGAQLDAAREESHQTAVLDAEKKKFQAERMAEQTRQQAQQAQLMAKDKVFEAEQAMKLLVAKHASAQKLAEVETSFQEAVILAGSDDGEELRVDVVNKFIPTQSAVLPTREVKAESPKIYVQPVLPAAADIGSTSIAAHVSGQEPPISEPSDGPAEGVQPRGSLEVEPLLCDGPAEPDVAHYRSVLTDPEAAAGYGYNDNRRPSWHGSGGTRSDGAVVARPQGATCSCAGCAPPASSGTSADWAGIRATKDIYTLTGGDRFSGDPLDYHFFIENLKSGALGALRNFPGAALAVVINSCTGEPRRAIEGCIGIFCRVAGLAEALGILAADYGDVRKAVRGHLAKVCSGEQVRDEISSLRSLVIDMRRCQQVLGNGGCAADLNTHHTTERIYDRLPYRLMEKVRALAEKRDHDYIPFGEILAIVRTRANQLDLGIGCHRNDKHSSGEKHWRANSDKISANAAHVDGLSPKKDYTSHACAVCQGSCDRVWRCDAFRSKPLQERYQVARNLRICFRCLGPYHQAHECKSQRRCQTCDGTHHSLLHDDNVEERHGARQDEAVVTAHVEEEPPTSACSAIGGDRAARNRLQVLPVCLRNPQTGVSIEVYALLDNGCNTNLLSRRISDLLGLNGDPSVMNLQLADGKVRRDKPTSLVKELHIRGVNRSQVYTLHDVRLMNGLPECKLSISGPQDVVNRKHFKGINVPVLAADDISLIIGTGEKLLHRQLERRNGPPDQPDAIRTPLGWTFLGGDGSNASRYSLPEVSCNCVRTWRSVDDDKASNASRHCFLKCQEKFDPNVTALSPEDVSGSDPDHDGGAGPKKRRLPRRNVRPPLVAAWSAQAAGDNTAKRYKKDCLPSRHRQADAAGQFRGREACALLLQHRKCRKRHRNRSECDLVSRIDRNLSRPRWPSGRRSKRYFRKKQAMCCTRAFARVPPRFLMRSAEELCLLEAAARVVAGRSEPH